MSGIDGFRLARRLLVAAWFSMALGTLSGGGASAKAMLVTGTFKPAIGVSATPTGGVTGRFDTSTDKLTFTVTYKGLTNPVIAAHFHGPAKPDQNAGVLKPIPAPYASPIKRTVTFTPAQARDLGDGLIYVNLHTQAHPDGEARAQLHFNEHP